MRCEAVRELLLTDYMDGEIDAELQETVLGHLAECRNCREIEERLLAARATIRNAPPLAPPDECWRRIRAQIGTERRSAILDWLRLPAGRRRIAWAFSGAAMIACLLIFSLRRYEKPPVFSSAMEEELLAFWTDDPLNGITTARTEIEKYFL